MDQAVQFWIQTLKSEAAIPLCPEESLRLYRRIARLGLFPLDERRLRLQVGLRKGGYEVSSAKNAEAFHPFHAITHPVEIATVFF